VFDADAVGFPTTDFFGNPRPDPRSPGRFDVGAVEYQGPGGPVPLLAPVIKPALGPTAERSLAANPL
jgi:hypothetical protein